MYIKEQFTPTRWLHIFQSAVNLKLYSTGTSKTCRKSRRWEGAVLHSMPSNHQKNRFTMKRKATAISMNGINRRTAEFYVASNNKSYYHRFTTINFAKPSWRAYTSMIPFIPNLAESGGSHRDNHHFQRMIARKERTAPQHTRFILPPIHPDKIIAALRGRYFSFPQIKSYVVVQSFKICFWLLTSQLQSVILVLERSRL